MRETDLGLLTDAARMAGKIALGHFRRHGTVTDKPGGAGPVTLADLAVNDMLHDTLRSARPDLGWLSEETPDTAARLTTGAQFIIDPIDGTRAFIDGGKDWAHSLAIAENGEITTAVVYLPVRDEMFTASLGGGAFLNGTAIRAATGTDLTTATILATRTTMDAHHWHDMPPVKRTFRSSLAYRLCLAATGRFDAMLTLRPTWEWDVAAGALIVAEAGGKATDRTGTRLRFNNPVPQVNGIVAGGALHGELIRRMGDPPIVANRT